MLASILNSQTAVEASIVVVRAFVKMRAMLALHQDLADRVEELERVADYHGQKFGVVSGLLGQIMRDPKYLNVRSDLLRQRKRRDESGIAVRKIRILSIPERVHGAASDFGRIG